MDKIEARKIIMAESQRAMKLFRESNPLPAKANWEYFNKQCAFINAYLLDNVSEETRQAAI